jgi:hypothetical protein
VRRADAHPDARPRVPLRASDLDMPALDPVPAVEPEVSVADILDLSDAALPEEPVIAMGPPSEGRPLHAPLPEVQELPADLDQPLAAFDPYAIPAVPMAPPPPVRPLRRRAARAPIFDDGERFETFELTPPVRPTPEPVVAPEPEVAAPITAPQTEASVQALLDRLERGLGKLKGGEVKSPLLHRQHTDLELYAVADAGARFDGQVRDQMAAQRKLRLGQVGDPGVQRRGRGSGQEQIVARAGEGRAGPAGPARRDDRQIDAALCGMAGQSAFE